MHVSQCSRLSVQLTTSEQHAQIDPAVLMRLKSDTIRSCSQVSEIHAT